MGKLNSNRNESEVHLHRVVAAGETWIQGEYPLPMTDGTSESLEGVEMIGVSSGITVTAACGTADSNH